MTIFEVSVKIECKGFNSYATTFNSQDGFYDCWNQIETFIKNKFDGNPTITHVLNTASKDIDR